MRVPKKLYSCITQKHKLALYTKIKKNYVLILYDNQKSSTDVSRDSITERDREKRTIDGENENDCSVTV